MSIELGWEREVFSLSLAIQALMWGITQPLSGMFAGASIATTLIGLMGWGVSIVFLAFSFVLIMPLLIFVARVSETPAGGGMANNTWDAVKVAFSDPSYTLLFFGFFVCGFHVQFIQTHLPAYIIDEGLTPIIGA